MSGTATTSNYGGYSYTFVNSQVVGSSPSSPTLIQYHPDFGIGGGSCGIGGPYQGNVSLTVTATLTWSPSAPGDTSSPPPTVDVLETGNANNSVGLGSPTGLITSANDGFGDSPISPPASTGPIASYGSASSGAHLIHLTVSGSQVTLPTRSLYSSLTWKTSTFNGQPGVGVSYSIRIDNRNVAIQPGLDPTFRKGSVTGQIVPNTPAPNGAMFVDTIAPDASGTTALSYKPVYTRSAWGTGSQYSWSFSANPSILLGPVSGTFNTILYDVSAPLMTYANPPITPGTFDIVTLKLTDSKDGASATNTCSVLFHAPYELWTHGPITRHPVPFVKGGRNMVHPDYSYLLTISNGSSINQTQNLTDTVTLSKTASGTIGGQQTLTPAAIASFQLNESITVGKTFTYAYTTQSTLTGAPHKITDFFAAMSYEDRTGTCDVFAKNGYQGNFPWQGRWTSGGVSLGILDTPYP